MKLAIFLALALALMPLVYSDNSSPTSDLIKGNFSAVSANQPVVLDNRACSKEYECKVASYAERSFWFGCYFDTSDNNCKCYKGDLKDCDLAKSSVSKDDWCAIQYECVENRDGLYQFNCYFDGDCRCFVGELSQCREEKSMINKSELLAKEVPVVNVSIGKTNVTEKTNATLAPKSSSIMGQNPLVLVGIAAGIVVFLVVLFIILKGAAEDSLVKARRFHRKAEELHEKGKEDEANKYYKLAEECRSNARGSE